MGQPPLSYTLKEAARPVSGIIVIDGSAHHINPDSSFAFHNRGRSNEPRGGATRWAIGSGRVDGKLLGMHLGAKGSAVTDNGLFVDGRLTYWDDELEWSDNPSNRNVPWHIEGEKVDATLTPFHKRHSSHRVGIATSNTHQAFGTWSGQAFDEKGTRHSLDGLTGWAERSKNPL